MKRLCYIFFFVVLPFAIQAQHFIGPTLSGNFVQTVDNITLTSTQLSGGGEIGVAYQYQREHLLLATSLNYSLQCPVLSLDSQWLAQNMQDTRGVPVVYRGLLTDRIDRLSISQFTIPLTVGGVWSGMYFLVGAKLCVTLAASTKQTAALKTAGDYNGRYYEWFEDMPNHGYHDFESVKSAHSIALNRIDVRLSAEVGYTFRLNPYSGNRPSLLLRIGAFAEYGVLNILPSEKSTTPRTTTDWTQYLHVTMTHIYASSEADNARANILLYGIRATLLFPVSKAPEKTYPCHCLNVFGN